MRLRPATVLPTSAAAWYTVLGALFGTCLLAIVVTMLLPKGPASAPHQDPAPVTPSFQDPVIAAFAAADRRDYGTAIQTLDVYLERNPGIVPARRVTLLMVLEHYAVVSGDSERATRYGRAVDALREQLRRDQAGSGAGR